jgi:multisubunit Na+/H+ antiporter MnhC subunit
MSPLTAAHRPIPLCRPIWSWRPILLLRTGVWGLINSRNAVRVLMSIELMLNAVNINLMAFSELPRWPADPRPGVRHLS